MEKKYFYRETSCNNPVILATFRRLTILYTSFTNQTVIFLVLSLGKKGVAGKLRQNNSGLDSFPKFSKDWFRSVYVSKGNKKKLNNHMARSGAHLMGSWLDLFVYLVRPIVTDLKGRTQRNKGKSKKVHKITKNKKKSLAFTFDSVQIFSVEFKFSLRLCFGL